MSDKPEPVKVRCPACSKKLGFPPHAVGRKAKCPACTHVFKVAAGPAASLDAPAAMATRAVPPVPRPATDDAGSLFDALAAAEQSAEQVELAPEEAAVAAAARSRSDAVERAARAGTVPPPVPGHAPAAVASAEPGAAQRMASALGSLARGCAFSAGGALIGAFIWYGIAKATGYQIGYVAWGVGALSGLGMQMGTRSESMVAGAIASGIALAGVVVGQLMVVAWVVFPMIEQENKKDAQKAAKAEAKIEFQREALIEDQTAKNLKSRGLDPDEVDEEGDAYKQASDQASKEVNSWSESRVRSEYKQYKARQPAAPDDSSSLKDMPTGILVFFFAVMLGLRGIIFCILGMVTAFKIGASGFSFGQS